MRKIQKKKFYDKLNKLIGEYAVYAPRGDSVDEISDVKQIKFTTLLSKIPSKTIFLPQNEELFKWDKNKKIEVRIPEKKKILFGIRPCDARAISTFDPTFDTKELPDTYYKNRRNNTMIITLGCSEPEETCFCSSFDSGPFDASGSDLLLMETGSEFIGIGKKEILDLFGFEEKNGKQEFEKTKSIAEKKVEKIDISGIKEKLDRARETNVFREISNKCINCGACTFLCPTCYCFDIEDVKRIDGGKRLRNWDSCMFKIYTYETSGNNPRKQEELRMRQRIMHKFNYYPSLFELYGCVGCGRCVIYCPVNFDIRETIKLINNEK